MANDFTQKILPKPILTCDIKISKCKHYTEGKRDSGLIYRPRCIGTVKISVPNPTAINRYNAVSAI